MIFQPETINNIIIEDWVRPSDWLKITKPIDIYSFKILNAVDELSDNWIMFKLSGTTTVPGIYSIDFGDGNIVNYDINGTFNLSITYQYNYSTISNSTISILGYKQVCVIGTSNIAITNFKFDARDKLIVTNQINVYSNFLEVYFARGWNYIYFNSSGNMNYQYHESLEYFYRDCYLVPYLDNMCFWLRRLKKVDLINTESVIFIYYTFARCYCLKKITLNLPSCNSASYSFNGSTSIEETNLLNLPKLTGSIQMYLGTQIKKIQLKISDYSDIFTNSRAETIILDISEFTTTTINLSTITTLKTLKFIGTNNNLSVINISLTSISKPGILEIFNSLPDRSILTAGTININNSRGAHLLNSDDILIATNKNWTVIP